MEWGATVSQVRGSRKLHRKAGRLMSHQCTLSRHMGTCRLKFKSSIGSKYVKSNIIFCRLVSCGLTEDLYRIIFASNWVTVMKLTLKHTPRDRMIQRKQK